MTIHVWKKVRKMQHKNPEYMNEIIAYVDRFYSQTHEYPTCSQIADNTSLQRTAVFNYLVAMHKEGKIEYDGKRIVTPFIRASRSSETRPVGVVGSISCGLPTDAEARLEQYVNLPAMIADSDHMYLLYAAGDSMIGAGIDDGDMVLVRRQETANDGEIVVAWVEGEGNTLKRLRHDGDQVILHPENPKLADIPVEDLKVQGVAVWVFKKVG